MSEKTEKIENDINSTEEQKRQQSVVDAIIPPEYIKARQLYIDTLCDVLQCLEDSAVKFVSCIETLKKLGYEETLFATKAIRKQMQIFESQLNEPD